MIFLWSIYYYCSTILYVRCCMYVLSSSMLNLFGQLSLFTTILLTPIRRNFNWNIRWNTLNDLLFYKNHQDQNSASRTDTESVQSTRCSTVSSTRTTARSHSSSSFRNNSTSAQQVMPSEYKVGGFFLTFPISNNTQTYSKGSTDIAKSVTEIRNSLRISETNFKFLPAENRQLYERTTINWNVMSGFKQN